jgi:ribosomal protein S6
MLFIMAEEVEQEEKTTRIYELGYHIVPTVSEEAVGAEVTALKDTLAKEGTQIIAEGFPRFRPLAYPVRKAMGGKRTDFSNAYFGWVKFEATANAARSLTTEFRKNEKLLRFILFKTVRESTLASPRAPRVNIPKVQPVIPRAPAIPVSHAPVSETELEKSLEKIIAE